jgi:DNA-binding NarL/FixJ family response regulator
MDKIAREFASKISLSGRETDVFILLANQVVGLKEIAASLKLSPNTVKNHFKSIFEKSETNSRSELLGKLLKYVVTELHGCRHLHKIPRVVAVSSDTNALIQLSDFLVNHGIDVRAFREPRAFIDEYPSLKADVVIADTEFGGSDGLELLRELRKNYRASPAFVMLSSALPSQQDLCSWMGEGVAACLERPIDAKRAFQVVMEQFIEDPSERARFLKLADKSPVQLDQSLALETRDLGHGGAFVPLSDGLSRLHVGDLISFQFRIDGGESGNGKAEIMWKRAESAPGLKPGVGLKFVELNESAHHNIRQVLLQKRVQSFIPRGEFVSN